VMSAFPRVRSGTSLHPHVPSTADTVTSSKRPTGPKLSGKHAVVACVVVCLFILLFAHVTNPALKAGPKSTTQRTAPIHTVSEKSITTVPDTKGSDVQRAVTSEAPVSIREARSETIAGVRQPGNAGGRGEAMQSTPQGNRSDAILSLPSFASQAIAEDLAPWRGGISQAVLRQGWEQMGRCIRGRYREGADAFRFQIIDNELYVDTSQLGPATGGLDWFPSKEAWPEAPLGIQASQGRAPLALLALVDTLWRYPGQIPDLDAVIAFPDMPCFEKNASYPAELPPPVFALNGHPDFADIPFPDHSFWGAVPSFMAVEASTTTDGEESMIGWGKQLAMLDYLNLQWDQKRNAALWRGFEDSTDLRTMKALCQCEAVPKGLDFCGRYMAAITQCNFKFNVFIGGTPWNEALKQRLACESTILMLNSTQGFHNFFSRFLVPNKHYLPVTLGDGDRADCSELKKIIEAPNDSPTMEHAAQVAIQGREFVEKNLQMAHIHGYIIELLQQYAALLTFKPQISPDARLLNVGNVVGEFEPSSMSHVRRGYPHLQDAPKMLGCCHRARFVPFSKRFKAP